MANFSKSFNFRNGLQVDNDKFIVKPTTGLVGIGSTAPTEVLDVVGNIKATGITSARDIFAGAGITVGYANSNRIMLDIDPLTGVSSITAQRFYGDGSNMSGIFAISVAGFVANSTNGGILTSFRKVGIGVTTPTNQFEVEGDSKFTGVTTFVGVSTADNLFADAFSVSNSSKFAGGATIDQANVTGVSTFTGTSTFVGITTNTSTLFANQLSVAGVSTLRRANIDQNLNIYGSATFGEVGGTIGNNKNISIIGDSRQFLISRVNSAILFHLNDNNGQAQSYLGTNLQVAGISTFSGPIHVGTPANHYPFTGIGVTINNFAGRGQASFSGIVTAGQLNVDGHTELDNVNVSGVLSATSLSQLNVTGVSTLTGRLTATEINSASSNVVRLLQGGTQVFNTIGAGVSVSNTLKIGSLNGGTSGLSALDATLIYGDESGANAFMTRESFNILNNDTGNFNYFLNINNLKDSGTDRTGDFVWHKASNPLMTLTGIGGSLGIGVTTPSAALEVVGGATIAGSVNMGGNVTINNLNLTGALTGDLTGNVVGIVTGNLFGNVISSGISTLPDILADNIGIGTIRRDDRPININSETATQVFVDDGGRIGIKTDNFPNLSSSYAVGVFGDAQIHGGISIGNTDIPRSSVDFSDVVNVPSNSAVDRAKTAYLLPPRVTTTQRDALYNGYTQSGDPVAGAFIFNVTNERLELYDGNGWVGLATVA